MIKFELVTLAGAKFRDDVYEVLLPTPDGIIAVFRHHMPLVSLATPGIISVRKKSGDPDDFMDRYAVSGGVIEILDNVVRVLVDEADSSDEINEAAVKKAYEEAVQLKEEAKDKVSLDHAQNLLDRTATQIKVAELKRHRKQRR